MHTLKNLLCIGFIGSGIYYQMMVDNQLQEFKERKIRGEETASICEVGMWGKARHPNLFFELLTWGGFAGFGKVLFNLKELEVELEWLALLGQFCYF